MAMRDALQMMMLQVRYRLIGYPDTVGTNLLIIADHYQFLCDIEKEEALNAKLACFVDDHEVVCQCRRENVSAGRSKTASWRGAKCPTGRFLLRAKQDEKRIASPAKVPETSMDASTSVLPSPQLILRPAPGSPSESSNQCLTM